MSSANAALSTCPLLNVLAQSNLECSSCLVGTDLHVLGHEKICMVKIQGGTYPHLSQTTCNFWRYAMQTDVPALQGAWTVFQLQTGGLSKQEDQERKQLQRKCTKASSFPRVLQFESSWIKGVEMLSQTKMALCRSRIGESFQAVFRSTCIVASGIFSAREERPNNWTGGWTFSSQLRFGPLLGGSCQLVSG